LPILSAEDIIAVSYGIIISILCIGVSVCAKADSKFTGEKKRDAVIPNTKKVINDIVMSAEIPFMEQLRKNMFYAFSFMFGNLIV
jgi:hypothetical protein